jgi:hypothetical protein
MKLALGACALIFVAGIAHPDRDFNTRYNRVESYEIRPGTFATPSYTDSGALCEVSIEKRHVQGGKVDLSSTLSRKVVLGIIDELAPSYERGKATMQLAGSDYIDVINGSSDVAMADYDNVSIQIFGNRSDSGDIAAIIKWKNVCASSQKSD